MKPISIKVDRLVLVCSILLLFLLEGIYLHNALAQRQYNTGIIQMVLLILSGFLAILKLKTTKVGLVLSGILLCFSMFFAALLHNNSEMGILQLVSKSFLWFAVLLLGYISTRYFNMEHFVTKAVAIVCVFFMIIIVLNRKLDLQTYRSNTVVTAVYYLLCCAPCILCMEQKKIRNVLLAVIMVFLLLSFKRSALLVAGCAAFCVAVINRNRIRKLKLPVTGLVCLVLAVIFLVFYILSGSEGIILTFDMWEVRFSEGGNSRFALWKNVLELVGNSNLFETLFGHGYNAVVKDSLRGMSAHNDFLEILYDYGLIGLIAFVFLIIALIRTCGKIKKINWHLYNGYVCALAIFLVASVPSHMLTYSTYFLLLAFYFGCVNGTEEKASRNQQSRESFP